MHGLFKVTDKTKLSTSINHNQNNQLSPLQKVSNGHIVECVTAPLQMHELLRHSPNGTVLRSTLHQPVHRIANPK